MWVVELGVVKLYKLKSAFQNVYYNQFFGDFLLDLVKLLELIAKLTKELEVKGKQFDLIEN